MTVQEFLDNVKESYAKYFNESFCRVILYKGFGKSIYIDCFLAKDETEIINGYFKNDMFKISFCIHDLPRNIEIDSVLPDKITLENTSSSFIVKPSDKIYYCDYKTIYFRKVTGTPERALIALDKFFEKLATEVKQIQKENLIIEQFNNLIDLRVK